MNYKLNLEGYKVQGQGKGEPQEFDVKDIIYKVMLHPTQKYKGFRFYTVAKIAERIKNAEKEILLKKDEYDMVKMAFDNFEGFGSADVDLVKRIYEPEELGV